MLENVYEIFLLTGNELIKFVVEFYD